MALTHEEKAELFETLTNSEVIEDRAVAIARLQDEYNELETANTETNTAFEELQKSYLTTQNSMKQLLATRSVDEINGTNKQKEEEKNNENVKFGFAKFDR